MLLVTRAQVRRAFPVYLTAYRAEISGFRVVAGGSQWWRPTLSTLYVNDKQIYVW